MITTGLTLAVITGVGFYVLFSKLPRRIKRWMQRHVLFTDAIACFLTYTLFGGTLVALFAAAWLGLIVSVMLALINNPKTNAMLERFGEKVSELKDKFVNWVAQQIPEVKSEEKNG